MHYSSIRKIITILAAGVAGYLYIYIYILKPDGVLQSLVSVEERETLPGEREIKALAEAYGEIGSAGIRDGEWSFILNGLVFYWSGGRLLPESLRNEEKIYDPYKFYDYPLSMPEELIIPGKRELILRDLRGSVPVNTAFLDALYGGASYSEIKKNIESIRFFGFNVHAHKKIIPLLKEIEEEILNLKGEDDATERFIENLKSIDSLSWRNVENTVNRSLHSYGIAIDFMPRRTGGRQLYWAWTRHQNTQWYRVPYEKRWMIPEEIVGIFERYGFVWGGKWVFYDNMHFEYRPELLILAGNEIKNP